MMDLFRASAIPDGVAWGDYDNDDFSIASTIEREGSVCSSQDWEIVGEKETFQAPIHPRTPRWCKHGNACIWQNCPFRHERCAHFDNWLARGKRGYNCRCITTDPDSCKSPEEGGCKYDHRILNKLQVYHVSLPCKTESELWDSFIERGLECHSSDAYDISKMSRTDKSLLIRSLNAAGVTYEDNETWMDIRVD
jgi:hypothetical protein